MKFRSLCVALTAVIGLWSSASALDLGLGVKGGLNLSRTWGNEPKEFADMMNISMRPGMAIGAAFQLKLAKAFAIQPEVLFSCKGLKYNDPDYSDIFDDLDDYDIFDDLDDFGDFGDLGNSKVTSSISYRYLEIPILFQILVPASDVVVPMVYAGPAISFLTGVAGKVETDGKKEDLNNDEIKELKDGLKSVDFGIAMGAGLGIKAGPGRLVLDVRFNLGLLNIAEKPKVQEAEDIFSDIFTADEPKVDPVSKNMALSFMLGYMFEF